MTARCLFLLLAGALFMACPPYASAQLPKRVAKCLPYPTLAEEIRMRQPAEPVPRQVRVHVIRVQFDPDDSIPADAQEEISTELQNHVFQRDASGDYLKELADEIADVEVRGTLRDRGYFKAAVTASLTPLWSEEADNHVAAVIRATPGTQYRTGDVRIESTNPDTPLNMSPESLRMLIPLQRGGLFGVGSVRNGLDNISKAFGREGYVDMTAEVETQVNDEPETVDLVVKINQQTQYRVGSVGFLSVNPATRETLMESLPKPGELFDMTRLGEFFKINKAILPSDLSMNDDVSVRRDPKTKTVAILFDFRRCPSE